MTELSDYEWDLIYKALLRYGKNPNQVPTRTMDIHPHARDLAKKIRVRNI